MVVHTDTERVRGSRQIALELLLSDHLGDCRPPCHLACPANLDVQGYVGLIGNGLYREALELIKERLPLPAAIGRVCPHPCEGACRRQLVEESVSICWLKQFAADQDLQSEDVYIPDIAESTGKKSGHRRRRPGRTDRRPITWPVPATRWRSLKPCPRLAVCSATASRNTACPRKPWIRKSP